MKGSEKDMNNNTNTIPRPEYPRPQFVRDTWMNLNGEWDFEIDRGNSGYDRGMYKTDYKLSGKIIVPFCPESKLSGVGNVDFMEAVWYKRKVFLSAEQISGGVIIHFGAVDYESRIYVNGIEAGYHKGGYVSFEFDITSLVKEGENEITVYAHDDVRDPLVPRGKQSQLYYSHHCDYTRTTGIWQTVWLEFVPKTYVKRVKYYPDVENCSVTVFVDTIGSATLDMEVRYDGRVQAKVHSDLNGGQNSFTLPLAEKQLWEVGCGRLYDVEITYGKDKVKSYFGLRNVRLEDGKFLINGKVVFQKLILDQGFYPDGIYTAPSDEALQNDIKLSLAMGFNGARLHEKVFEERFLSHCDRLGYIVWGEYGNWGLDHSRPDSLYSMLPDWMSEVERDFNHPAIVGWCPFNETSDIQRRKQCDDVLRTTYEVTKAMDSTRPCIDSSGWVHVSTDIFDVHDYDQNPETFKARYDVINEGIEPTGMGWGDRQKYNGEPYFVSEYGGIKWSAEGGWGYGNAPKSEQEFLERFKGLADALIDNPKMIGLCYTQLTDVEQEQNGLYTYERQPKFDPAIIRSFLNRPAAIEQES